jgi:hypothetical protein
MANVAVIYVIKNSDEVGAVQMLWWSIPVVSIVYLLLSLVLGDEAVDTLSWVPQRFPSLEVRLGPKQRPARPELSRLTLYVHSTSM